MFEKVMATNILYLMKYVNLHIQEAQRTPRSTQRQITVKLSKAKVAASLYFPTSNVGVF